MSVRTIGLHACCIAAMDTGKLRFYSHTRTGRSMPVCFPFMEQTPCTMRSTGALVLGGATDGLVAVYPVATANPIPRQRCCRGADAIPSDDRPHHAVASFFCPSDGNPGGSGVMTLVAPASSLARLAIRPTSVSTVGSRATCSVRLQRTRAGSLMVRTMLPAVGTAVRCEPT